MLSSYSDLGSTFLTPLSHSVLSHFYSGTQFWVLMIPISSCDQASQVVAHLSFCSDCKFDCSSFCTLIHIPSSNGVQITSVLALTNETVLYPGYHIQSSDYLLVLLAAGTCWCLSALASLCILHGLSCNEGLLSVSHFSTLITALCGT